MTVTIQEAIKDTRLRTIVHKYLVANGQEESYAFLFEKAGNQVLYEKYISERAPKQVNIPYAIRKLMDKQARATQWSEMDANMAKARKSIVDMLNVDVMTRFAVSEEYQGFVRSKDESPSGKMAVALKLKTDKVPTLTGLLSVYNDARTETDKFQAYEAMAKLAGGEPKLNLALKAAGQPVPAALKKGDPAKGAKYFAKSGMKVDAPAQAAVLNLLKKYNATSLRSVRATVHAELIKAVTKYTVNPREMAHNTLKNGGWVD